MFITTLPNHHPRLGGRTKREKTSLTGTAKAYVPIALLWVVVVGGGGTRYFCLGGVSESDRSTLTYVSYASPKEDSGTHANKSEEEAIVCKDEEEVGRFELVCAGDFCCMRATKPGMLSFAEGDGCT